nr:hypothetical protein CFP56_76091 [Quercus suber]
MTVLSLPHKSDRARCDLTSDYSGTWTASQGGAFTRAFLTSRRWVILQLPADATPDTTGRTYASSPLYSTLVSDTHARLSNPTARRLVHSW